MILFWGGGGLSESDNVRDEPKYQLKSYKNLIKSVFRSNFNQFFANWVMQNWAKREALRKKDEAGEGGIFITW